LAAYQATSPAIPQLLGLLEQRDPRLRTAGAHLIAWFPQHAEASLRRLRTQLAVEPDLDAKATMVVAVGLLAGAHHQTSDAPAFTQLLDASDPVLRWAAAIALTRLFVDDPPERAVQELLPWATGERVQPAGRHIHFDDVDRYTLSAIVRPGLVVGERAADALLARLAVLDADADAESPVWALLEIYRTSRNRP
jgi:hypothetical protein